MQKMKRAVGTRRSRWDGPTIPLVEVQPRQQAVDRLVDGLAEFWNEQVTDEEAYGYFHESWPGDRGTLLSRSLYRYPERDRQFLARLLLDLARAVNIGLFPYLRH